MSGEMDDARAQSLPNVGQDNRMTAFWAYLKSNWSALFLSILGLVLISVSEPARENAEARYQHKGHPEAMVVAYNRRLDLISYTVEHLGAVLIVAMLIRLAIEEAANQRALTKMERAVKARLDDAFVDVDKQLRTFKENVEDVNDKIRTIQVLVGGSLDGVRIKGAAKDEMERAFLNPPFFRPIYHLHLTLCPADADSEGQDADLILVKISTDYQIENISNVAQPHNIRATLDNALYRSATKQRTRESKFLRCEFGPATPSGQLAAMMQPYDIAALEQKEYIRDEGDDKIFDYTPPELIPTGSIYRVHMRSVQQMRDSDAFVWNMRLPTESLVIKIDLEGTLDTDNFSIRARPIHHVDHKDFKPTAQSKTSLEWRIDGVLLPYQGVQIWWSR